MEIEVLRKLRGITKAKLTKFIKKIDNERNAEQSISKQRIEVYIARLDEIHAEFVDVQRNITTSQSGEPTVAEATDEEDFEEKYIGLKVLLNEMLASVAAHEQDEHQELKGTALTRILQQQSEIMQQFSSLKGVSNSNASQASTSSNEAITELVVQQTELLRRITENGGIVRRESNVKLPDVVLPTFDGRIEEWKRFAETFQSLIHSNNDIPAIQKFQYLATSLSDSAAKIIESIELTGENYEVAWNLLKKRYDDPRAIKKKHIQCLFDMSRVGIESSSAIRELVDSTAKHLRILKSMELPTDSWDELIIHLIEAKLDEKTLRAWEQSGESTDGNLDTLTTFLAKRCRTLERIEARAKQRDVSSKSETEKQQAKVRSKAKTGQGQKSTSLATTTSRVKCYLCDGEHLMYRCEKFLAMPIDARVKEVQRLKLCHNCLRNDHSVKACKMESCKTCSERHNTLLHGNRAETITSKAPDTSSSSKTSTNVSVHHAASCAKKQHVIMATAVVNAARANGANVALRILLDSASEANFITQAACNKLGVKRNRASETVTGLNEMESQISQSCEVVIQSRYSNYKVNIHCFVVPTITKKLPSVQIEKNAIHVPSNVKLADIDFHKPDAIDMLVGAEFFFDLLESEKIELGENLPVLKNTKLGWIIAGSIAVNHTTSLSCVRSTLATLHCSAEANETLNKNLERFWDIETVHSETERELSAEEKQCEEFFDRTTQQDSSGRFVVRLPFRKNSSLLGKSREIPMRRLAQLERRFERNATLKERYTNFMREYQELGHMSPVNSVDRENEKTIVYLPHHGVIKEASSSTKLRTVFDASSKTDSGVALNDILHVGPTLQSNLIDIVIRFRFHNIALTGDLRKMYHQIIVHNDDRDYQRILWRETPYEHVKEFQLNTVTYGETSSAYLAIRCVRRLAELTQNDYPIAARVILDAMYVDDIMTGADDVQGIIEVQQQLTALLQTGGFEIHKWCSNRSEGLSHVPEELREDVFSRIINSTETIKTLGLEWCPRDDNFRFAVEQVVAATTKRQVLSAISKFFDPLGLVGPILTSAKLLKQETWRSNCNWDDPLPATLVEKWETFRDQLKAVQTLLIPRRVVSCDQPTSLFLQGFRDASEKAYGACVYIQAKANNGIFTSRLLCSKARVAPIKSTSIPRLELCSAVLLSRLIANVRRSLRVHVDGLQAWTDSTVALCWIRGDIARWKTFVANRVSEIVQVISADHWGHVKGEENPADLISRGTNPRRLQDSDLWWFGPVWLKEKCPTQHEDARYEPTSEDIEIIASEEQKITSKCNVVREETSTLSGIIDKFSSLTKIERVLAICLRYIANLKRKPQERAFGRLSVTELRDSHRAIVRHAQNTQFAEEISALKHHRDLRASSKLIRLHPFLDDTGVLRVGGRLQNASLPFEQRHPVILSAGNRLTRLLFEREHRRLLHASQLLLLSSIREKYWPLKGRDLARQVCHA